MLFESDHIRVTAEYGIATLGIGFPGTPVNGLSLPRLREVNAALAAIEGHAGIHIVVLRSTKPMGFCEGLHPAALDLPHVGELAWFGQSVCARLARLQAVSVAFIEGPCLGVGFELALACDYRLALAKPDTHLGFPNTKLPLCFGGTARLGRGRVHHLLRSGRTISGREAKQLGLVDHAFSERRAKIELRTFLDEHERRPGLKRASAHETGWAAERRALAQAVAAGAKVTPWVVPPMATEIAEARGFLTPLEAAQTQARRRPQVPATTITPARAA